MVPRKPQRRRTAFRIFVEIAFIIFLFYANLLMGDFTRRAGHHSVMWAVRDIFTPQSVGIAILSATVGFIAIEFFRRR